VDILVFIKELNMLFHKLDKYRDMGLLILRIGIGIMFMYHGYPKLTAGSVVWTNLGGALSEIGFIIFPTFLGFMAALAEFGGGLLLILGLFTRPASFFLFITMIVAALMHLTGGDSFGEASHAIESAVIFFSLLLIGPGNYSLDEILYQKGSKNKN
jgi:putative oxidoreductase